MEKALMSVKAETVQLVAATDVRRPFRIGAPALRPV